MKQALALILAVVLLVGSGVAMAQQAPAQPQPQQPQMGPMMMCPCMMMMSQKQMTPEEMAKMQEQMRQWMQTCPMMKMTGPQQQPAQPQPKK